MSEAMICRRGTKGESIPPFSYITQTITQNTIFTVPKYLENNTLSVRLFGAGGGGGNYADGGGGGGWMNNGEIEVTPESQIQITIGSGGAPAWYTQGSGVTGGTSSFGTYLSANGGEGCTTSSRHGGNGGAGGGGHHYGGIGYQFGGGGCGSSNAAWGGNGGTWGGGGGVVISYIGINPRNVTFGVGGTYGGNGGKDIYRSSNNYWNNRTPPTNGTNTMGNSSIDIELQGAGIRGYSGDTQQYGGGGGGYGGNGGYGGWDGSDTKYGGGGGGYGADGGNDAGGGGGYGKNGMGGSSWGGGGAYGPGGNMGKNGVFGGGGGCESLDARNTNCWGGNGICIISYYGVAPK